MACPANTCVSLVESSRQCVRAQSDTNKQGLFQKISQGGGGGGGGGVV